ncbi:MAG TPA: biopolymer transporter ExbD [Burkholderiaceae bacterium]|nr:biopolymer transporter ExbD [Burkholderiaceae bacterium]
MSRLNRTRAPLAAINITSLVDVLLILVAALLLLAPQFLKPVPVDLPKTSFEGRPTPQMSLVVSLARQGTLIVDNQPTPLARVQAMIVPEVTTVQIAADGGVAYRDVIRLVESLRPYRPRDIVLISR